MIQILERTKRDSSGAKEDGQGQGTPQRPRTESQPEAWENLLNGGLIDPDDVGGPDETTYRGDANQPAVGEGGDGGREPVPPGPNYRESGGQSTMSATGSAVSPPGGGQGDDPVPPGPKYSRMRLVIIFPM